MSFREITDVHEIEQDKHYVERFQLIPVDEQTYSYEQHANHSADGQNQVQTHGTPIDASELGKRDSSSADREISMSEQQNVPTTVYVSQSNDDGDVLRYPPNTQVRYEEDAYHHARYEYQAHPGHGNPEDIKVELVRAQQHHHQQQSQSHAAKIQIYEQHDGGPRAEVI